MKKSKQNDISCGSSIYWKYYELCQDPQSLTTTNKEHMQNTSSNKNAYDNGEDAAICVTYLKNVFTLESQVWTVGLLLLHTFFGMSH